MIKTFLFDLGNVVVHFSHERMFEQLAHVAGMAVDDVRRYLIESEMQHDFERGAITRIGFHERFEGFCGRKVLMDELHRAGSDIFWLNDSLSPVLQSLRTAGFRLVLLSNTCVSHHHFVRDHFSVLDFFDELVLSYEEGAVKPEPEIYEAALQRIDCRPQECFYTDDIPEYVLAGRRFGLHAEVYRDTESLLMHLDRLGVQLAHGGRKDD